MSKAGVPYISGICQPLKDNLSIWQDKLSSEKAEYYRFLGSIDLIGGSDLDYSWAILVRAANRPTQTVRSKSWVVANSARYTLRHHLTNKREPDADCEQSDRFLVSIDLLGDSDLE